MADPEYIPMPGPGEFCTGAFRDGQKCCLVGWCRVAAGGNGFNAVSNVFHARLYGALEDAVSRRGFFYVSDFNDDDEISDRDRAEVWREAAGCLGYVEVDE